MTSREVASALEADWDMSAYFPSFEGPEHVRFGAELRAALGELTERASALPALAEESFSEWERVVLDYESLGVRASHLRSYVGAHAAADGRNPDYQRAQAELSTLEAAFEKVEARLLVTCAAARADVFRAWSERPALAGAGYALERFRRRGSRRMSTAEEDLALDLGVDGIDAWSRLYDTLFATLSFDMQYPDGRREALPFSARRSLLENPDRRVRRAAFEAGNRALDAHVPTLAAALNHIAGTRLTLYARRGHADFLEPALTQAALSRAALDAMWAAVAGRRSIAERALALSARDMGVARVAWYDLGVPLGAGRARAASAGLGDTLTWERAKQMVGGAFDRRYPALGRFFQRAVAQRWVDFSRRPGKRPGAFCTSSPLIDESRVFMTFQGTLGDVSTLAHEIGHAFHGHVLAGTRWLARRYPMTLAESASTFAELILADGALRDPDLSEADRALISASLVSDAVTFLMDIPARFHFERAFYEERRGGEVSAARLSELMSAAQLERVGPSLDPEGVDPLFWASKLHFFIARVSFYNFPYTFGYLLSRGLFAELERQGPDFLARYEEFLRRSGSADAPAVVRDALGVDLEQPDFWERSIQSLEPALATLERAS